MKYSLTPREIPRTPPSGFPLCSGYISPYIPPLVIIQIQYWLLNGSKVYKRPIQGSMHLAATSARCTLQVVRNRSQPLQNYCTSVQLHFPPQCDANFNQKMSVVGEATKQFIIFSLNNYNLLKKVPFQLEQIKIQNFGFPSCKQFKFL